MYDLDFVWFLGSVIAVAAILAGAMILEFRKSARDRKERKLEDQKRNYRVFGA